MLASYLAVTSGGPIGGLPKPDFLVCCNNICGTVMKWYEVQARQYNVPLFILDAPFIHTKFSESAKKYVIAQTYDYIEFLEKQVGRKMDFDRMLEVSRLAVKGLRLWQEVLDTTAHKPAPMTAFDAFFHLALIVTLRGTQVAVDYYQQLVDEMKQRIKDGIAMVPNEKYRLLCGGGLPSWFVLSDFNYFNGKGASFPVETTYPMVAPLYEMDIPESKDPIEHLAWRWLGYWTFWYDKARKRPGSEPDVERLITYIEDYKIDGVVMHEAFSCRTWHVGLIWQIHQLSKIYKPIPVLLMKSSGKKEKGTRELPSLILESDIIDITSYSEVDTRNKIDAFIETLESVRQNRAN